MSPQVLIRWGDSDVASINARAGAHRKRASVRHSIEWNPQHQTAQSPRLGGFHEASGAALSFSRKPADLHADHASYSVRTLIRTVPGERQHGRHDDSANSHAR